MKRILIGIVLLLLVIQGFVFMTSRGEKSQALWSSDAFVLYRDSIVQGRYRVKAISSRQLISNYQSQANLFKSARIDFKFSINGQDNEMRSGVDHHFNCVGGGGRYQTPLIEFGKQYNDTSKIATGIYLAQKTVLQIQLDMRSVFKDMETKGYYTTFSGDKIYKQDFKGVFIAGGSSPLTWDFDNLHNFENLQLRDPEGDHIYEIALLLNDENGRKGVAAEWKQTLDTRSFPQYESTHTIIDALYNLSLEEMIKAVEADSTLRTGKEWAGVWTRDVSYSTLLSMAILQPKVAQKSLMKKVRNGMIVQDTGTGGAYPVSTDRMVWSVAAWEIFKVTGENDWLEKVYPIIKKSLEYDLVNAYDPVTGLVKGESSFLDWREQTYPRWMQPADIYESMCLGTNAVHYQSNRILSQMAELLHDPITAEKHSGIAAGIKKGIEQYLWNEDKGYYNQFLYGRINKISSPRAEALGEALCVLFDIAGEDKQKRIIEKTPVTSFGIPCIYPQIPNIPPYHNDAVWPFVESFWAMACAKAENESALMTSLAAIYRPGGLFVTNKENFVATTGDYVGTQINSDNMLWSLSGNLSMVYKVLFGIRYEVKGLSLHPFVPKKLDGARSLTNFRYRQAIINFQMRGHGSKIKSITLDGKAIDEPFLPATLHGVHTVKIELAESTTTGTYFQSPVIYSPEAPVVSLTGNVIRWDSVDGAVKYRILENGKVIASQTGLAYTLINTGFSEIQVIAESESGIVSFASEPVRFASKGDEIVHEAEHFSQASAAASKGFTGAGYVKLSLKDNVILKFEVDIPADGNYYLDFRYANGTGPVNTENKCAMRALSVDNVFVGTIVFPQRGTDEWSNWGYSNGVSKRLKKGKRVITLSYDKANENMNQAVNDAMVDNMRITKIGE